MVKVLEKGKGKVYRYSRGEDYSCIVVVDSDASHVVYEKIKMPPNPDEEIVEKFLDEAERYAREAYEREQAG